MTDQAPMTDERAMELLANAASIPKRLNGDTKFLDAWHHIKDRLRAGGEAVHFRYEMERMRSVNDHLSRVLTGIHALLYPPTHVVDGATMAFRPKELDAHGLMQSLSDRIRAIPGELAAYAAPPRAPVADGAKRDREKDRERYPDAAFNRWLDEGISDGGHTVYDALVDIADAWSGWSACPYYEQITACCGRRECGGECGNEWRGMVERAAEVPAVDEAFRVLVEAVEREFCSDATERGETMNGDNEKVSFPENRCRITFGMIRNARAALSRPAAESVAAALSPKETQ